MDDQLTEIKNSFADMHPKDIDTSVALIKKLIKFLKDKETDTVLLNAWWNLCLEEDATSNYTDIARKIKPLWEELSSNFTVFLKTYQNESPKLKLPDLGKTISAINDQINDFSQNGADFTVLAARMMLFSKEYLHLLIKNIFIYTSDVFTSNKKLEDCIKDKTNDKGQFKAHSIYELLSDTFNPEDINRMLMDNLWELYKDDRQHDKEEIEKTIE